LSSSFSVARRLAIPLFSILLSIPATSQTVTTVASFPGDNATEYPGGTPAQGRDGELYGTSFGTTYGSVFKVSTGGSIKQLYALDGTNAINPFSGLTMSSDGSFYGTSSTGTGSANAGVLFRVTPGGIYTVLHEFTENSSSEIPTAPPTLASNNDLYGTAYSSVYSYTPSGTFSTVISFTDVEGLTDPLVQASNGNLYGTGNDGGANKCGGIFEITPAGSLLNTYSFNCTSQGGDPGGPLIQASDGNFYGLTPGDGKYDFGTVFRMNQKGIVTPIYSFQGAPSDGVGCALGLVQGTDGYLYGVTQQGGTNGNGIIFQISTAGAYTVLYNFPQDTALPFGLLQHTDGKFYGFDAIAGTSGYGTVFSLDMGLGPFVTFVRHFGGVGQTVQILGQGLTGATSVTFNGVTATSFSVVKDTFMTAVVPSGATTGPVVVTTRSGALTSNVSFRVIP